MRTRRLLAFAFGAASVWTLAAGGASAAAAQTIQGTLMDVDSDEPIALGLVMMYTEQGDSITADVTTEDGRFSVTAPDSGSFVLVASAFGYKETPAGVFELGDGGSMDVQFRIASQPMAIEGILVDVRAPVMEHNLVRNGYVRRLQRGLGLFITPADIERANAISAPDLFAGMPGVFVRTPGGGAHAFKGETVQLSNQAGYCTPTIYLDGVRILPEIVAENALEYLAPLATIEAVEIYRRPSEVPVEYGMIDRSGMSQSSGACGILVIWTRSR